MNDQEHAAKLEEYKQLCEHHRHDDRMKWVILGLGYTAAGALIGLSLSKSPAFSAGSVAAAVLSLGFVVVVTLIYRDIDHDTHTRLRLLRAAEGPLNLSHYSDFEAADDGNTRIGTNTLVYGLAFFIAAVVMFAVFASLVSAALALSGGSCGMR